MQYISAFKNKLLDIYSKYHGLVHLTGTVSSENVSYLSLAKHQLTTTKHQSDPLRLTKMIYLLNSINEFATHQKIVQILFDNCTVQVTLFANNILAGLILLQNNVHH